MLYHRKLFTDISWVPVIEQAVRNIQQVFGEHMKAFDISPAVLSSLKSITQDA